MIIDSMIVGAVGSIIGLVVGLIGFLIMIGIAALVDGDGLDILINLVSILFYIVIYLLGILIGALYEAYFLSTAGATLGKQVMRIKVQHDGQNPTFMRAFGRFLAKFLSGQFCGAGYIMACFTQDNKALHDMICDTIVVKG